MLAQSQSMHYVTAKPSCFTGNVRAFDEVVMDARATEDRSRSSPAGRWQSRSTPTIAPTRPVACHDKEVVQMSRRISRVAAILAVGALAGSALAGCSAPAPEEEEAAGPVILRYWSWAPNIAKIVEVWNQPNPDIQVEVNTSTGSNNNPLKL